MAGVLAKGKALLGGSRGEASVDVPEPSAAAPAPSASAASAAAPGAAAVAGSAVPAATTAPATADVGAASGTTEAESLAAQKRQSNREMMRAETAPETAVGGGRAYGATGGALTEGYSSEVSRAAEERQSLINALRADLYEPPAARQPTTARLPPSGGGGARSIVPLRAVKRGAGTAAARAGGPRRTTSAPRAGSAPRSRPAGGELLSATEPSSRGSGAMDAGELRRANKELEAENRRLKLEAEAETLDLKRRHLEMDAEIKRLKVEAQRRETDMRRMEREVEAYEGNALLDAAAPMISKGGGGENAALVKALKQQLKEQQAEVRAKQSQVAALSGSAKNARLKELEVQCAMSKQELMRQKELARMQAHEREDVVGRLEDAHAEEVAAKERAVAALRQERATLQQQNAALDDELGRWMDENDQLRNMIVKLERRLQSQPLRDKENERKDAGLVKRLQADVERYQAERKGWEADKDRLLAEVNKVITAEKHGLEREQAKSRKQGKMLADAIAEGIKAKAKIVQLQGGAAAATASTPAASSAAAPAASAGSAAAAGGAAP